MATRLTADEAISRIPDGATVLIVPMPSEEVYPAFKRVFETQGSPKDLTVLWAAGLGPFSDAPQGMNHFAVPGLMKRLIAAHIGLNHAVMKMVAMNGFETYILPQGVMCQLFREIAGGRPGLVTQVGLGTFVDPRVEGGKANQITQGCEDLSEVIEVGGKEYLFYKSLPIDVAVIRGTAVDPQGNLTAEDEAIRMENLEAAMAAHSSGGIVIAQVERVLDGPARPHQVFVPGVFVDYVVVAEKPEHHPHTLFVQRDPAYTGEVRADLAKEMQPMPLGPEKIICRRAAMELRPGMNINLGVGVPMGVAPVAFEEGLLEGVRLNTEVGVFGGLPQGGKNFGPAKNPEAFISQAAMFDFYDGGGLDLTCVGMAQVDKQGNVNVSRLGLKVIGCGGFINITQAAKKCCFCGEFSAVGTDIAVENGQLNIRAHGKIAKFMDHVEQITFNGEMARREGREVLYITERCVFKLVPEGLMLIEVAPGVDIQTDILDRMDFKPIVPDDVKPMLAAIFEEAPLGMLV